MKQPARTSSGSKPKRKTRETLNQEARDRKRDKKHRGNAAGSRGNPGRPAQQAGGSARPKDPRIGSKTPVPLGGVKATTTASANKPAQPDVQKAIMSPQEELAMLENDARLDALLDRLESGDALSGEEQAWLDQTLDRIDVLMEQLGIALDDDADEEDAEEDMYRLLKGGQS
ncbi:GTPase-activating protein [Erwinia sp. OLTSP20]|uniref:Der GTPase-activating protein YihI n=1 Tax=unclassified Erwinia TaxID=2622719 RepID=UPI000C197D7D|nr:MULTISPECIES: Der GTPase-activating protein YihI [unclassified Erwinia]PIJ49324.1 GTPase-activating protein [Erwinia sp. OAMSP11]PIJ70589.1 GTPase-activating protein [Erwinia sp. OLSSP12]PIJ80002.1 GTPase-activating protein [Erwinia sp. OLCASP19]PIJ81790.1 GTPase-activating protein [Erwinia sp. OLMTSP26]PIJ84740.1 GTPase-activating protein [Erwinia sp. OLMDSP33]